MLRQISPEEKIQDVTSPYYMFKYSIRSELTRKYYERRLRRFFDFIDFLMGSDIEERCNSFAQKGKNDGNWVTTRIIRFMQYEKERVEKGEITAATLSNFVFQKEVYLLSIELYFFSIVFEHWLSFDKELPPYLNYIYCQHSAASG